MAKSLLHICEIEIKRYFLITQTKLHICKIATQNVSNKITIIIKIILLLNCYQIYQMLLMCVDSNCE